MSKVIIRRGKLWYAGKALGPVGKVYAFPGEETHLGPSDDVVRCTTPARIDLVLAAGDKVVGCEVKTLDDLVSSHRSHRLHRQLATLKETVDVICLMVRGLEDSTALVESVQSRARAPELFWGDWLNWQTQGVYILPVPMENYLPRLLVYLRALCTSGARSLAGTDLRESRERRPGWLLRRIPGIGERKSSQLIESFGSTLHVLSAAERGEVAPILGKGMEEKLRQAARS